ncbi:beta-ketoacyl synthase N-terminal-like domain-containing protein [Marinivivus vitaminiproducens]|uniref:type I polyketide synthase n=1 Tax=Marinivivus vitaminiproducens TaxID=3035935 RepID=UPI00279C8DAB|nr:beta-ketoacyl synthase N-terminal-like domain-containing protein [Geminicoccaceae bacterium SCSIO 64248]
MTHAGEGSAAWDQEAALVALRDARRLVERFRKERDERVAVVGMAGRFPGADDIERFWAMLDEGRSGLCTVEADALEAAGVPPEQAERSDYVRVWGGFEDPSGFDAAFFGYSPREAELLDPQQRVFLECAWSALEHAGYDSRRYGGRVGVYAGGALTSYLAHVHGHRALRETTDPVQIAMGQANGLVPARVSYHLDLNGPSCGVQTTCSTSLVAVHMAARSLLARECDMALAGAAAVGQARPAGYIHQREGILSPDGLCRPFDADAQGTVFGNGVGAVVLKRLSDAIDDGDTIYGVILGSAVGNDGAGKVGLTAPGVGGQAETLKAALEAARVDPASIDYVEGHGTGTALGDPIEIAALNRAYGPAFRATGGACALSSVKGNVGHLDAAAGVAGLIKVLLALRHGRLPATLNFRAANPACDFAGGPFHVLDRPQAWAAKPDRPRRAAVSSFGIGGTNAHVILEETPAAAPRADDAGPHLVPLSARTPEALDRLGERLGSALERSSAPLADVAYTLQVGRRPMAERRVALCRDKAEAVASLRSGEGTDVASGRASDGEPTLMFLFSGQGSQHAGMARGLYEREPAFREAFDACANGVSDGMDLRAVLWGEAGRAGALDRTENAQPALFAVEYALASMWLSRGVRPQAALGHSIGEYVAACLAGVFSVEDAMTVVCARGRLMQSCEPGAMLSAMLSEAEARAAASDGIEIAAVNGPRASVLAGPVEAVQALAERLERSGIGCRMLKTSHAFHTAMMEPALAAFAEVLGSVTLRAPTLGIVSNVTGDWLTPAQATDPAYWVRHLRETVRFGDGLARLIDVADPLLLELGPGSTLTRLARQQLPEGGVAIASLPEPGSDRDAADHALMTLGRLWVAGLDVDWHRLHPAGTRRRVGLPSYPFERQSYWIGPAADVEVEAEPSERSADPAEWFHQPVWERRPLSGAGTFGRWLVLGQKALQPALGGLPAGADVVWVEAGETFAGEDGRYVIDPLRDEHYRMLLDHLATEGWRPDQIVLGFGLEAGARRWLAFESALALGRALAALPDRPPLLSLVGRGTQLVTGSETLDPDAAMVLGLAHVLPQELRSVACRTVDLAPDEVAAGIRVHGLADTLALPWDAATTAIALRGGFGWAQSYVRSPLPEPADLPVLRRGAAYLVAGDLTDGLGLGYARTLIRELDARVLLAGRADMPPVDEWDRWLVSHGPNHEVSQLIRELRSLGEAGRDYVLHSGDPADPEWLDEALSDGEAKLGPIHGVFHTAAMGHHYHCPLADATFERHRDLFTVKNGGVESLERALAGRSPAFVLLQASLSTLVGGAGFAAYAAANSFLDAFALSRRDRDRPVWQAIDWDACQTYATPTGGGVGALLANAFTPNEVWRATRAVLARPGLGRVAVTAEDPARRFAKAMQPEAGQGGSVQAVSQDGRPSGLGVYVAPRDRYEEAVAGAMGDLLGIAKVGATDNFFELGGHSLLAIQVITRLRREFDIELPMRALLFETPTVEGIGRVIREAVASAEAERESVLALLDEDLDAKTSDGSVAREDA